MNPNHVQPGSKYSVFKVHRHGNKGPGGRYEWSDDGFETQRNLFGGCSLSWAVRVLAVDEEAGVATAVTHWGELEEIPLCAFAARIPDVTFLPGAIIRIDGARYYVEAATDDVCDRGNERCELERSGVEVYTVRSMKGGRPTMAGTFRRERDGRFTWRGKPVTVKDREREVGPGDMRRRP